MADLRAKEAKDCDFHRMQTCDQLPDLTVDRHTDALDPFQYLQDPSQRRTARRLVDLIRKHVVLTS